MEILSESGNTKRLDNEIEFHLSVIECCSTIDSITSLKELDQVRHVAKGALSNTRDTPVWARKLIKLHINTRIQTLNNLYAMIGEVAKPNG